MFFLAFLADEVQELSVGCVRLHEVFAVFAEVHAVAVDGSAFLGYLKGHLHSSSIIGVII